MLNLLAEALEPEALSIFFSHEVTTFSFQNGCHFFRYILGEQIKPKPVISVNDDDSQV